MEMTDINTQTPIATPRIEIAEMNDINPFRRLAREYREPIMIGKLVFAIG
jgi:hypothetical protein